MISNIFLKNLKFYDVRKWIQHSSNKNVKDEMLDAFGPAFTDLIYEIHNQSSTYLTIGQRNPMDPKMDSTMFRM